jgi:hypothetical protein
MGRSLTISFLLFSIHYDVPGRGWSVRIASGCVSELNLQGFKIHSFFLFQSKTMDQSFICLKHVPRRCTYATSQFLVQHLGQWNQCFYFLILSAAVWFRVDGTKSHGHSALLHVTNATLATQLSQAQLNVNQRCRSLNGHKQERGAKYLGFSQDRDVHNGDIVVVHPCSTIRRAIDWTRSQLTIPRSWK